MGYPYNYGGTLDISALKASCLGGTGPILPSMPDFNADAIADALSTERPLPEGQRWNVTSYEDVPGWLSASVVDEQGRPVRGMSKILVNEAGRRVPVLSSPAWAQGRAEVAAALVELGSSDLSDRALHEEIARRVTAKG